MQSAGGRVKAGTRRRVAVVVPKVNIPYRYQYTTRKDVSKMIEQKKQVGYLDTLPASGSSITTTGTFTNLSVLPQGDGQGERVGEKVMISGLRYHGLYKGNTASGATSLHYLRVVLFRWNPDNNVDAPSLAKMFEITTDNQSHFIGDRTSRSKFKVLKDMHIVMNSINNGNGVSLKNKIIKYLKINKPLLFNEGGNTGKGHIYILEWSNGTAGANTDTIGNSDVRLFYKEQ